MRGKKIRTSSIIKPPYATCPNCGRKVKTRWEIYIVPDIVLDHRKVMRVKIDGSDGNGKSKAKTIRELEKTSIIV